MKVPLQLLPALFLIAGCSGELHEYALYGEAQGTTYSIKYWGDGLKDYQSGTDSILKEIDSSLSTYLPGSVISRVNESDSETVVDVFFREVFACAKEVNKRSGGAFDPSVMPLVKAWGFGPSDVPEIDTSLVDSLKALVGMQRFEIRPVNSRDDPEKEGGALLVKSIKPVQLDFNGIAQGYSIDVLARFLEGRAVQNYLVEIGGEVRAGGTSPSGKPWNVGIDKPDEHAEKRMLQATLPLNNTSVATSGSYRKFYELNGIKYSHTIDPSTGYPVTHSLLSVSVLSRRCMDADAYATAFMVMGFEKSKGFISDNKDLGLEAFFIYSNDEGRRLTYATPGMAALLHEAP